MPWANLSAETAQEFTEVQTLHQSPRRLAVPSDWRELRVIVSRRLRYWSDAEYRAEVAKRNREFRSRNKQSEQRRRKARSLQQLRDRLRSRSPIRCANHRCRLEFVPYRSDTRYCTVACRLRANANRYHKAVASDARKHALKLARRRAAYAAAQATPTKSRPKTRPSKTAQHTTGSTSRTRPHGQRTTRPPKGSTKISMAGHRPDSRQIA